MFAGNEQRHDRPAAGPDQQGDRRQRLASPITGLQRVRRRVPVWTIKGWEDHSAPGWLDRPGGPLRRPMEGRFLLTLVATDIATGWSESLPIVLRV